MSLEKVVVTTPVVAFRTEVLRFTHTVYLLVPHTVYLLVPPDCQN
jgi:hypothetical protein